MQAPNNHSLFADSTPRESRPSRICLLVVALGTVGLAGSFAPSLPAADLPVAPSFHQWTPTPPMGWNSFDCFVLTVTEAQVEEQADVMAAKLLPFGWDTIVVDHQWYNTTPEITDHRKGAKFEMDEYGRWIPAPGRFPSGMKGLAEYVHAKGLKFGLHLMRGIPRQAVEADTRILGTELHARDIADTASTCTWNADMYGVDMSKAGAQEYYDSVFRQFAEWGLDFVKVDDLSRPYSTAEIEAIRKAIDRTGRPMVFSTSPGATPLEQGEHVRAHANMWRISDDFWDRWKPLEEMFKRLDDWTHWRTAGAWPDADMLPFGILEFTRQTRFTRNEQVLCMTLWCIARSPLIFGGNLTRLDEFTLGLLTNREVIAVNQASANNRQVSRDNNLIVWAADVPGSADRYVALFNAQDNDEPFDFSEAVYTSPVLRGHGGENASISVPVAGAKRLVLVVDDGGDNPFYDNAAWIEPTLHGPDGMRPLTGLKWTSATTGWGDINIDKAADGTPLTWGGAPASGIGTHSVSAIAYDLPPGCATFTTRGVITPTSGGTASVQFKILVDPRENPFPAQSIVTVNFSDLGCSGPATVRDLWSGEALGLFTDRFSCELSLKSARLVRISPTR